MCGPYLPCTRSRGTRTRAANGRASALGEPTRDPSQHVLEQPDDSMQGLRPRSLTRAAAPPILSLRGTDRPRQSFGEEYRPWPLTTRPTR
jgi:hypothetical protein